MILQTINFFIKDWANFIVRRIPDTIRSAITGAPKAELILNPSNTVTDLKILKNYIVKSVEEARGKKYKKKHVTVVDLVWPRSLLLVLENDQPTQRKVLSSKLLGYKLKNDTPFLKDDIAYSLLGTQKGFQLYVAKKDDLFALRDSLKSDQIALRDIISQSSIDQNTLFSFRVSLKRPKKIWVRANMVMSVLLFTIIAAQFGSNMYGALKQKTTIQNEITVLQTRAVANAKEISGLNNSHVDFDTFYKALEGNPTQVFILHALSEALDDNTWLTEFKLQKNRLQLAGITSNDTEELLDTFGKINILENIKLSSQAQKSNRNQGSKFSIEADVK